MTWWGHTSASRGPMVKNMQHAYPFNVLELHPDGIAGMFYGTRYEQIVLNKRKGFAKSPSNGLPHCAVVRLRRQRGVHAVL